MSAANPTTSNPSEQPTSTQIAELEKESVVVATPQGNEVSLAEAHPEEVTAPGTPAVSNPPGGTPSSAPVATVASNTLPETATNLQLLALTGIVLIGGGFSLRVLLR
jgi:hypothetical protein